jgi:polar amino acid transport system substrate-binding protein
VVRKCLLLVMATLTGMLSVIPAHADAFKCVALHYPPLVYLDEQGQPTGMAFQTIARAFQQLGHSVTADILPWARAQHVMRKGEADCILTIFRNAEREQFLDFSNEVLVFQPIHLYARHDRAIQFAGDLDALKDLRIGTALKVDYGPKFGQMRPHLRIVEAPTIELNFKQLAAKRIDLVISPAYMARNTLATAALHAEAQLIGRLPIPVDYVESHIAFAKARNLQALRDALDKQLRTMAASGETQQFIDQYRLDLLE